MFPVVPPQRRDGRIFLTPCFLERVQSVFGGAFRWRGVDGLKAFGDAFVVLPRHIFQAVADHVNDAQLDLRFRKDPTYRVGQALETVAAGDKNILDAAISKFGDNGQPELRP